MPPAGTITTKKGRRPPTPCRPQALLRGIGRRRTGHAPCSGCRHRSKCREREASDARLRSCNRPRQIQHSALQWCEGIQNIAGKDTASLPNRAMPSSQSAPAYSVKSVSPPTPLTFTGARPQISTCPGPRWWRRLGPSIRPRCGRPTDRSSSAPAGAAAEHRRPSCALGYAV